MRRCYQPFAPPIPTQFEDAESYNEQIRILCKRVEEALLWMKNHKNDVLSFVYAKCEAMVKERLKKFDIKYEAEFAEVNKKLSDINKKLKDVDARISREVRELYRVIDLVTASMKEESLRIQRMIAIESDVREAADKELQRMIADAVDKLRVSISQIDMKMAQVQLEWNQMQAQFIDFKLYVEERFTELKDVLTAYINTQLEIKNGDRIIVRNPATGKPDVLASVLEDVYNYKFPFGITAGQFNEVGITCVEFDALNIKVEDFNNKGYLLFWRYGKDEEFLKLAKENEKRITTLENVKWWSQLSQGQVSPYDAYSELVNFVKRLHQIGFTCNEFDKKSYTAEVFNQEGFTVEQFNFYKV